MRHTLGIPRVCQMTRPKYDWRMRGVPSDSKLPSSPMGVPSVFPVLADISRPSADQYTGFVERVKRLTSGFVENMRHGQEALRRAQERRIGFPVGWPGHGVERAPGSRGGGNQREWRQGRAASVFVSGLASSRINRAPIDREPYDGLGGFLNLSAGKNRARDGRDRGQLQIDRGRTEDEQR